MLIGIEPEHNPVITDPHPLDIYVLLLQKTDDLGWRSATACLDPEEGGEGIDGRDEFGQIIAQGVDPRLAKLRGLLLFGQDCDHEGDRASNAIAPIAGYAYAGMSIRFSVYRAG